jgi:hypothetical protein
MQYAVLKFPSQFLDISRKSGRQFLWAKKDDKIHGKCLAKWDLVYRPKDRGGLGVINLRYQNQGLLMKNLYKFYNKQDVPWVDLVWKSYYNNNTIPQGSSPKGSFWWRDYLSLLESFKDHVTCTTGNGDTIYLWKDSWEEQPMETVYPHLHSYARNATITLKQAFNTAVQFVSSPTVSHCTSGIS